MKHAILILAHKDFDQLRHLIEYFVKDCYVYVHIDKKAIITSEELHSIDSIPQVRAVYRKYKVHWGGFSILKTEMFLLRQVLKDGDCDYVHLISGQDYPIKPLNKFLKFFEDHKGKEFIRYSIIPNPKWDNYTYSRFDYFYFYDYIDKPRQAVISFINKSIHWQKKLGIKRNVPNQFNHLYGSTQWFSLTREAIETLINYTHFHNSFYKRARWTFAAEEFYIATVLLNNLPQNKFYCNDLRYIRWKYENGNRPANLGVEHFHCLAEETNYYFARKFEKGIGADIIVIIDKYLLSDADCKIGPNGAWTYLGFLKYSPNQQLINGISTICSHIHPESILDIGCGAGFLVAALRRRGVATTGYDANPYTPELSSYLLPKNDTPCGIADLTDDLEAESPFDLVLCVNTLSQIPHIHHTKCFENIYKLTGKYLLISENIVSNDSLLLFEEFVHELSKYDFVKNDIGTSMINKEHFGQKLKTILFQKQH